MVVGEPEVYGEKGRLGVVVVHDIFGRDGYVASVARDLAAAGYPTATVDLYGGQVPKTLEEGFALRNALTPAAVLDTIDAGRAAVERRLLPHARVGPLGFCMGGGFALLAACHRRFSFVVDFYGRIEHAEEVAGLQGSLLLLLASQDERITPWSFSELLPQAVKAEKRISVELYPNVRHAFHRPGSESHHAPTAAAAWQRTLDFLAEQRATSVK